MYIIIRLALSLIFLTSSIIVIKKSKIIRKKALYAVFATIALVFCEISVLLPVENLFLTFDSPESVYNYYSLGNKDVELVVDGEGCSFVVDRNDIDTYLFIPKTVDGWKIGNPLNSKTVILEFRDGISVSVYQYKYKKTEDYFITVLDTNGGELILSDENNTEFFSLERYDSILEERFVTYYGHISSFASGYSIIVNGNEIVLGNQ